MTAEHVEIRPAEPDDWRIVKAVRLTALQEAPYAFGSSYQRDAARKAADWRSWIGTEKTRRDHVLFLAHRGDEPVGMVGAFHETATSVMLVAMWVSPVARRTGTGRRLTQGILDWAADAGARRVTLWVADDNPRAIALYEATGFKATGKHRPLPSAPHRQLSEYAHSPK